MKKFTLTKSFSFFIILFCAVNSGFGQMNDLIISEYAEGSGNNKYIEIFNGTGADVSLANYQIWRTVNGGTWIATPIIFTVGSLTNGSTYIVANPSASTTIIAAANMTSGSVLWNGNDAVGLAKDDGTGTFFLIDAVGAVGPNPGAGWDVAGTTNATANHTLVRKSSICSTNTNWSISAGTTIANSEWIVLAQDDWTDIGMHSTSCCIYTSIWTSTGWSPSAPTINTSVTIDYDYDTSVGGSQISFSACSLTVTNNATLNVANNTFVEVQNDITVDAGSTFLVQPYAAVVQIDDAGTVTNNGIMTVVKKTAPMNAWYEYTYWSSPVTGETISNGLSDSEVSRRYIFNAQNFLDATAEISNDNSTGVGQDDIDDNGDDWQWVDGTTVMQPGVGYASTHSEAFFFGPPFSTPPYQFDYSFDGPFNNGIKTVPIYRNDSELADSNWNLIGNPYPSAIDADLFLAANANIDPSVTTPYAIDGALFLWSQNTNPSGTANGNQVLNFSDADYAIINGTGETVGGDGLAPTNRKIPSGQAFFVSMSNSAPATVVSGTVFKANSDVIFNNSMRVKGTTDNSLFFKNSNTKGKTNTAIANKIWVNLTSDNGVFNQTLVGYINGATNNDDGMYYDAIKNLSSGTSASLYTTIEGSNKKFAIQGKDVNSINEDEIINLGFKTTINVATLFKLSVAKLEGDFLTNNSIFLIDNLLNKVHDLSVCDYTFTSDVGEFNSRFEIAFTNKTLATNTILLNTNSLKIVELQDDNVQFNTSTNLKIKTVNIYDLLGRQLYHFKGQNTSETYKLSNLNNSIYIAKVELSNGAVITKKAVKK